jgi:hypothetical protein
MQFVVDGSKKRRADRQTARRESANHGREAIFRGGSPEPAPAKAGGRARKPRTRALAKANASESLRAYDAAPPADASVR